MDLAATVAAGLGPAWASGLNLYAACAALGILGRIGYIDVPGNLVFLEIWWVIAAVSVMYVVEFVADKVPGFDSFWDGIHTFIRIPAGAFIAALAFSDGGLPMQVGGFLAGGALAAETHFLKAGTRGLVNTSPEPFSNCILSLTEDALVVGVVVFALRHPAWSLIILAILVVLAALGISVVYRVLRRGLRLFSRQPGRPSVDEPRV